MKSYKYRKEFFSKVSIYSLVKRAGYFPLFENAATLLGSPLQYKTIQHNCTDIKFDFYDAYSCLSSSC